jgi:hypothetical protein
MGRVKVTPADPNAVLDACRSMTNLRRTVRRAGDEAKRSLIVYEYKVNKWAKDDGSVVQDAPVRGAGG